MAVPCTMSGASETTQRHSGSSCLVTDGLSFLNVIANVNWRRQPLVYSQQPEFDISG
jgi:hypothetical protein